jgi:phosphoglycerate dehydrogenase-like enzyme
MNKLLVLSPKAEKYLPVLRERNLSGLEINAASDPEEAGPFIADANIILGVPTMVAGLLSDAGRLEWIQSTYAGVEALCKPDLRTDYLLTGVKGVFHVLMSEYVMAYILAMERHLFETRQNQFEKIWKDIPYRSLEGLIVGICGLGSIGQHIAKVASCFGMRVRGFKRSPGSVPNVEKVYTPPALKNFLAELDYLVITLPLTSETEHLFNTNVLRMMKPSAVLMNIGRGPIVVEADLIKALNDGTIGGAVLDVFDSEPLGKDSPFWDTPNVIISPHNAGVSVPGDVAEIFCNNYRRFLDKRPLKYMVDFEKGY